MPCTEGWEKGKGIWNEMDHELRRFSWLENNHDKEQGRSGNITLNNKFRVQGLHT